MTTILKSQKGAALIVALGIMAMLALLGVAAITTSDTEMHIAYNDRVKQQSFYIAEAGVERVYGLLQNSLDWRDGFTNEPLGNGAYNVVILDSTSLPSLNKNLLVRSTGEVRGAKSTVELIIEYEYSRNMYVTKKLELKDGVIDAYRSDKGSYESQAVNGPDPLGYMYALGTAHLIAEGEVKVKNGSIHGSIEHCHKKKKVKIKKNSYISGDIELVTDTFEIAPIPPSKIADAKANNDAPQNLEFKGRVEYNPAKGELKPQKGSKVIFNSGTYYFKKVEFERNTKIIVPAGAKVVIYVKDDWKSKHTRMVNADKIPANFQIYCTGKNVEIGCEKGFWGTVYAPKGKIKLREEKDGYNEGDFYGSITGKELKCDKTNFHLDKAMTPLENEWSSIDVESFGRVSWQEL